MSSVAERSAIITLRGVKLIESSQSALTLSMPSTTVAPVDPADGGREKDFLRQLDDRGLGELVHRLPIGPAAAAPLEQALAIRRGIGPGPDQLREALGRIYASDFLRLPSGRGRRQGRFGGRSRSRRGRRLLRDDGRSRGRRGRSGGEVACCPASGAGGSGRGGWERERTGLQPPARPGAKVRTEPRARRSAQ